MGRGSTTAVRFGDVAFLFDDPGDSTVTIPDLAALSADETAEGRSGRGGAPEGTVTILFTDIADSTAIGERLGDRRWLEVLRMHNAIVREQMQAQGGYEVKTAGDGFMVAFTSARRALQCAIDVQRALVPYNDDHPDAPLSVRIGLHTGEPVREADDFYGWHVNLAGRIAASARGGEILVSSLLKGLIESAGDITFSEPREVQFKGVSGIQRVFAVAWQ
ncbi:MAG: adenylate/guanylate cyclase domain-containing protein [Dehalococcoidia bacterium]|nr:adenylate/guanylate cyclase domain-containing protein [Dehalococcoidia bacterium]